MKRSPIYVLSAIVAVLFVALAFVSGVLAGRYLEANAIPGVRPQETRVTDKLREVERLLDREALVPADESSKTAGAIQGMLMGTGDRYAAYFDAEQYQYFNEQSGGEFFGIGVNIAERDSTVYIVSVISGTPAEESGVKADDIILEIDDIRRSHWTSEEVVKRVRGPEGSVVKITMWRPAEEREYEFTITRAKIDIPNVMTSLEGEVGYIRLMNFNARSDDELREEIDKMEEQGAKGFVLDLRDNPGGLLDSSVDIASLFIEDGVIVTVENRAGKESTHRASGRTATEAPLVVLINGNSASASEVVAGALQDYGRATLVGEQSFGKGSVQSVRELSFGGAVKFTTAHYLTPLGRKINGTGLTPDVVVEMEAADQADEETDVQRARAIELVREKL